MAIPVRKMSILFLCIVLIAPSVSLAFDTTSSPLDDMQKTSYELSHEMSFSIDDLEITTRDGYDILSLPDAGTTAVPGEPYIPYLFIRVALPQGMSASAVSVDHVSESEMTGTYDIMPAQPVMKISESLGSDMSMQTPPSPEVYGSDAAYPSRTVELVGMSDLAGQAFAELMIYPLHYRPLSGRLEFITSLEFTVECETGYEYGDYLPSSFSEDTENSVEKQVKGLVVNPDEVVLTVDPSPSPIGVDPGDYEYVIITRDSWKPYFQGLANWRTEKGLKATMVSTSWIYNFGLYSGSNEEKIRAFVEDAYTTWGTRYFLIGADTGVVPCGYVTFPGVDEEAVATDTYYADFDGDFICEVNVGRASVSRVDNAAGGIGNFIRKVMEYEQSPPEDYVDSIALLGFDLDNVTAGENATETIRTSYVPPSWTVSTEYDSEEGTHREDVISLLNAGTHLVAHIDHCNQYVLGTGMTNHDESLGGTDIDAMNNGDRQSIINSLGCWANSFDVATTVSEHFVRDDNGGSLAFIGNSRYGLYYGGDESSLSFRYQRFFFESFFDDGNYMLGECFSHHKNDAYIDALEDQYIFSELTLLGDPALEIWTAEPQELYVTYPSVVMVNESAPFVVRVRNESAAPIVGAMVTLTSEDGFLYMEEETDIEGNASFSIISTEYSSVKITVSNHDFLPKQISVPTAWRPIADVGGPYDAYLNMSIVFNVSSSYDPDGSIISYSWDWEGDGIYDDVTAGPVITHTYNVTGTFTLGLMVTDDDYTTSEDSTFVDVVVPPPNIAPTAIAGGPYENYVNMSITMDASDSYDPDGSIVLYEWDWESDGTFDYNSTYATAVHAYDVVGNYSVLLRVWDEGNATGTDIAAVSVLPTPPNDPPRADIGGPYEAIVNETLTVDASDSYDPDGGIELYEWDWTSDGTYDFSDVNATAEHVYDTVGTYMVTLRVKDNYGMFDEDAAVVTVIPVPPNQPPYAPDSPSPADDAIAVSTNPTLLWSCSDPEGDPVVYDIYFGMVDDPLRVLSDQATPEYTPGELSYNTTYYWKIVAKDNNSNSCEGPVWSFTTDVLHNNPPSRPVVSGPSQGTPNVPVQYSVASVDPDGNDVFYYVEWGDGEVDVWCGPYASGDDIVVSHTYDRMGTFTTRVRARDTHGEVGPWGSSVITMPVVPDAPWLGFLKDIMLWLQDHFTMFERLFSLPIFDSLMG